MKRVIIKLVAVLAISSLMTECLDNKSDEATPPSPTPDPGGAFQQGQQPVPTTGSNLADYDTARVRCDYSATDTVNNYNAQCVVVSHQSNGQEIYANGVVPGVTLAWQAPQSVTGSTSFNNCNPDATNLTYQCNVTVNSNAVPATVAFVVRVQDPTHPPQTQSATLMLPYSVGVAGGFMPSMPFQYVAQATTNRSSASTSSGQMGYQQFSFPATTTPTTYPTALAMCNGVFYYASQSSIFKVVNGTVTYFAGSPNSQDSGSTSTVATRVWIDAQGMACAPDGGILVASYNNRIYKITPAGVLSLVAGTGGTTDSPDGTLATSASLSNPIFLASTPQGDVIFSEPMSNLVRMVTHEGILQTVAGAGTTGGYSGDGGRATAAMLLTPQGIALGADGSIYFAELSNATVRKVDPKGVISTVAGTGTERYQDTTTNPLDLAEPKAVYVDANNNLYVTEAYRGIKRVGAGGSLTQVISAGPDIMATATSMALDIENLATENIRSPNTAIVASRPYYSQLAVGGDGTFYVDGYQGVLSYAPNATTPNIFVGAADSAPADCKSSQSAYLTRFFEASAIAIMPNNSLSVLDYYSQAADQLVLHNLTLGSNGGQALATASLGCQPTPPLVGFNRFTFLESYVGYTTGDLVAGSDGSLYVANMGGNSVLKINPQGQVATLAGGGTSAFTADGAVAATASLQTPSGIALGPDGSVYVLEFGPNPSLAGSRIRRITPAGILTTVGGNGGGGDTGEGGPAIDAQFTAAGMTIDKTGQIFLADMFNNKIKMIDVSGNIHTIAGGGTMTVTKEGIPALQAVLSAPSRIALTNDGTLYFITWDSDQVMQMKPTGNGAYNVAVFFGSASSSDCGTSKISGTAAAGSVTAAVNSSLAIMCQGVPRGITVRDTCPGAGGSTRIAISQGVDEYANIIEIVQPCGT